MAKYREYMKNQLTELLTEFGQIDELFMDYTYAEGAVSYTHLDKSATNS